MKGEDLFKEFPGISTREWMDKIHSDLKGSDFNEKLIWIPREGFEVKPFYRREDNDNIRYINTPPGDFPYSRGSKARDNNWHVRQNIDVSDYSEANNKAKSLLKSGVDSIGFIIADPDTVNEKNVKNLLKDFPIGETEINFICAGRATEILSSIIRISNDTGVGPEKISGAIEADPVGRLMTKGKFGAPVDEEFDYLAALCTSSLSLPSFRTIQVNTSRFTDSGSDNVMELAYGLSMGSEYLTRLSDRGLSCDDIASKIRFSFGIGSGYFMEIAKLRAARLLWSLVLKGYNAANYESIKMNIHCTTAKINKSKEEPFVNMIRTQTEAMSAILGGTDSLTVEPFDITFGEADEFSERIARNQQLILKEEAFFDRVADPAGGSYYIENLTKLIAENAWKLFLEIEEKGGFIASSEKGFIRN